MGIKAIFSAKERTRLRDERKSEQERLELEAKKLEIRNDPELSTFVSWFEGQIRNKRDSQIDWVSLGYAAYRKFWGLTRKYPEIMSITGFWGPNSYPPEERVCSYLNDEASWCNPKRDWMEEHHKVFIEQEKRLNLYGDYMLADVGPLGSSEHYMAVAYLSYAYYERSFWIRLMSALRKEDLVAA
jgi:hypothetical protein